MRQDAEQRVGGEDALAFHQHQQQRHGNGGGNRAEREAEAQEQAEAHAEQARMRQRLAEIGHAPPHDEAADGARNGSDGEARQQGALEEGLGEDVKHGGQWR